MSAITVDRTCVVIADGIPATQKEIIKMMLIQVYTFVNNVEIIDFYENDKLKNFIESDEIEVVKVMESWTCKDWDSTFNHFKVILTRYYRNVVIINAPTFRFMDEKPESLIKRYEEKIIKDPNYCFSSSGKQIFYRILRLLFVKAASKSFANKNVYQFTINPNEVDYRNIWNFRHYIRIGPYEWKGTQLGPTYEYALSNMYIQDIDKVQDFCWYASSHNKPAVEEFGIICGMFVNRRLWSQWWKNPITGIYGVFDKTHTKRDSIDQPEYYYNLMLSKYTAIPETDDGSFPIVRFMESIILGCVPLIHYRVDWEKIKLTDNRFYDIIKSKNLLLKEFHQGTGSNHKSNSVCNTSERLKLHWGEDENVIKYLRTSKYYRLMTDEKAVTEYYNKLFKGVKYGKRI